MTDMRPDESPARPSGAPRPEQPRSEQPRPHQPRSEQLWRVLVGEQLRAIRVARGESLRGVAGRARVSPQYLSEIERGFKEPSSEILAALGASLDTTLLELTSGVAERLHESTAAPAAVTASGVATAFALAA
ncbi:helix-turn-helix domain-containing protein [Herbiconiux sp. YIM B11900]|uniref:helix-turn-helix domain-containing protein n=1 Tax=Herbiconiux sp. YIM B11900 TaxID=3404131 RepID=UPI003F86B88B